MAICCSHEPPELLETFRGGKKMVAGETTGATCAVTANGNAAKVMATAMPKQIEYLVNNLDRIMLLPLLRGTGLLM
jgi:hypothetical protein